MANPLYDALFGAHSENPETFLILPDGKEISYKSFVEMAAGYASAITELGVTAGDRVAVQVEKSPQALALIAGCIQAGVVFVPLNTAYTHEEMSYFVDNSGAKLLVSDGARADAFRSIDVAIETLNADGSGSLTEKSKGVTSFETVARSGDDLAAFLYTSGTTGRSKGAMLSQGNLLSNARTLVREWRFDSSDVLLHALPIFHVHGLFVATNVMLLVGGKMIFLPKFDLDQMIELMPQATSLMGVPTFYTRLLNDARFTRDVAQHMRLFVSGSAPLLSETHVQFEKRTGHRILERYGMTETSMNTSNPYDGERRAGTVGFALPDVDLKITDPETGETLPDGEIGVIAVRGPNVFQGYWQMPEKTAADFREDEYFVTGDLAKKDADGYVHIVGRTKDLIISGGLNIYPKEIEQVLDAIPGVLESAVIAVPHPDFGECPVAVVVPEEGTEINLSAMTVLLPKTLAKFKHPKKFVQLDALPRNTMGKVQKNLLRDQFKDLFA